MITVPIYPWYILPPVLFRFMEKQWVDEFFNTGRIRLSSFKRFSTHPDERRLDVSEGEVTLFLHTTTGTDLFVVIKLGGNAYALSTTLRNDEEIANRFGSSAYMKINNPTAFGAAIARQIPRFRFGVEGSCRYQTTMKIHKLVGDISVARFNSPGTEKIDLNKVNQFFQENFGSYPYFLKHTSYVSESEYRFIWVYEGADDEFLDVTAPEAIQYCEPPSEFHR